MATSKLYSEVLNPHHPAIAPVRYFDRIISNGDQTVAFVHSCDVVERVAFFPAHEYHAAVVTPNRHPTATWIPSKDFWLDQNEGRPKLVNTTCADEEQPLLLRIIRKPDLSREGVEGNANVCELGVQPTFVRKRQLGELGERAPTWSF